MEQFERVEIVEDEKDIKLDNSSDFNTKPKFLSHLIAGLVDLFTVFLLTFGLYLIALKTPLSTPLTNIKDEVNMITRDYMLSYNVGEKVYEYTEQEANVNPVFNDNDGNGPYIIKKKSDVSEAALKEAQAARDADQKYQNLSFNYKFINYGYVAACVFISEALVIFLIPLINRNRATIGRLLGGTVLINKKKEIKASPLNLLARFLFTFFIESALPLLFLPEIVVVIVIMVARLVIRLIDRKNNRCLVDMVSRTMVVDKNTFKPITEQ